MSFSKSYNIRKQRASKRWYYLLQQIKPKKEFSLLTSCEDRCGVLYHNVNVQETKELSKLDVVTMKAMLHNK